MIPSNFGGTSGDDAPGQARGERLKYLPRALAIYFALFAIFALISWRLPDDGNWISILPCAIVGAWTAVVLVWLGSAGRTDDSWLLGQIVAGIAMDAGFNFAAKLASEHKVVAAACISVGNLGLLTAAIGIGLWVARGLLKPNYLVLAAIVGALTDIFSVYAGPTKHIVGTSAAQFLAFAWGLGGQGSIEAIVGAGDFIFLALFFSGARRFGLDDRRTLAAMLLAIVAGFLSLLISPVGIPALPFFAVALLLAHGRELKAQMKRD